MKVWCSALPGNRADRFTGVSQIGKIHGTFRPSEYFLKNNKSKTLRAVNVNITVEAVLEGGEGLLQFRVKHRSEQCGFAEVDYVSEAR